VLTGDQPFKMLGANITANYTELNACLHQRNTKFFDTLDAIDVHPIGDQAHDPLRHAVPTLKVCVAFCR
jgi:hypothetical protein